MRPIVLDKCVKFRDHSFNRSREIPPKPSEVVFSTVFRYTFRSEVDSDVISGMTLDYVVVDVRVKFGYSMSNSSRDIRGADFVMKERDRSLLHQAETFYRRLAFKKMSVLICSKNMIFVG